MIDFNALVAPINDSTTDTQARSATWAALRVAKAHPRFADRGHEMSNMVAAIDAAAWQAGLSYEFRQHAMGSYVWVTWDKLLETA